MKKTNIFASMIFILLMLVPSGAWCTRVDDSTIQPAFLAATMTIQERAFETRKVIDKMLSEARNKAQRAGDVRISQEYERLFLGHMPKLSTLWTTTIFLHAPRSDLAALCEAIQVQKLTLTEASTMIRFLGLRLGSRSLTQLAMTSAQLLADLSSLQANSLVRLSKDLSALGNGDNDEASYEDSSSTKFPNDYVEIEKRSSAISQRILSAHQRRSVRGVHSLSDLETDELFRPALQEHRNLRLALSRSLDNEQMLSEESFTRVTINIRHAADSAAYIAYRLQDSAWLDFTIRLLKMEASFGTAIVDHLRSEKSRAFWLSDDGMGR